jgi:hypothetical protein
LAKILIGLVGAFILQGGSLFPNAWFVHEKLDWKQCATRFDYHNTKQVTYDK